MSRLSRRQLLVVLGTAAGAAVLGVVLVMALTPGALQQADLNLPDGAPVAWAVSMLCGHSQSRMAGPSVMLALSKAAAVRGWRVVLLGSTPSVQRELSLRLRALYPSLQLVGGVVPPFRDLDDSEEARILAKLRDMRPDLVFVSLGAPKQEKWMLRHQSDLGCYMVGVGAAQGSDWIL